jgi:hypothetical protein
MIKPRYAPGMATGFAEKPLKSVASMQTVAPILETSQDQSRKIPMSFLKPENGVQGG